MKREAEVEVMSIALLLLQGVGERDSDDARIPWRTLDALADAFRKGGVDPHVPNLGRMT